MEFTFTEKLRSDEILGNASCNSVQFRPGLEHTISVLKQSKITSALVRRATGIGPLGLITVLTLYVHSRTSNFCHPSFMDKQSNLATKVIRQS